MDNVDNPLSSLEAALATIESQTAVFLGHLERLKKQALEAHRAARVGNLKSLRRSLESTADGTRLLDGQLHELLEAWPIDEQREEDYLASGAYTRELLEEAEKQSLGIYQQEGFLACYPSLLRVQARERALLVDRKVSRDLRPSLLVKRLLSIQKQPPKFAPAAFLEVLLRAYDFHKAGRGVVLPLLDLYETLTLLPQARRDYTQQEFARDLYLLDGSGVRNTKDGTPFRLHPGATAAKNRSKLLIVVTREGVERTYYGIEFDAHGR